MITRNIMCPYGCGQVILRTEDRGKTYYSDKNGKTHTCPERLEERNSINGYVDDGQGCVEKLW